MAWNDAKCPRTVQHVWKRPKTIQNNLKRTQTICIDGTKWAEIVPKKLKTAQNSQNVMRRFKTTQKGIKQSENGSKQPQTAQTIIMIIIIRLIIFTKPTETDCNGTK
jgi:hypothetical protein